MRSVDTRFWSDGWVRRLNALDRYAFLYFLTNEHSSWCGVYEVDLAMIAFESGIDEHDLKRSILPRLSPKVIYIDGWVYIKNFQKYHSNRSKDTLVGIQRAWLEVPERIRLKIKEIEGNDTPPYGGGEGVSPFASSLALALAPTGKERVTNFFNNRFWPAYPHKVAKAVALKAMLKINPDENTQNIIMIALDLHKKTAQWTKDDGKFIPHPATWLNQKRWEDEIKVSSTPSLESLKISM